ncbi:MAG: PD-(D/E)XK nuclease family protein [Thermoflexales bacterium]|nr:PD-(D/E)XK nuclease family protein [Thermoflexales bacterium]
MPAGLERDFLFSQHSLGDFVACPRRFYLRYVVRQAWPQLDGDPLAEQDYLARGRLLHRWIERDLLGIPTGAADAPAEGELGVWWARYKATDLSDLPTVRHPELALTAGVGAERVYARFDLLAIDASAAIIIDWKTLRGQHPPGKAFFARRPQTRIYRYVLVAAGASYNGGRAIDPAQVSMRYWLANFPAQPWVSVRYSDTDYAEDARWLQALLADVRGRDGEAGFEKTDDRRVCAHCPYRALCGRGDALPQPADIRDDEADPEDGPIEALEY